MDESGQQEEGNNTLRRSYRYAKSDANCVRRLPLRDIELIDKRLGDVRSIDAVLWGDRFYLPLALRPRGTGYNNALTLIGVESPMNRTKKTENSVKSFA